MCREAFFTSQMGEMCPICNADVAHVGSIKIIIIKSKKKKLITCGLITKKIKNKKYYTHINIQPYYNLQILVLKFNWL